MSIDSMKPTLAARSAWTAFVMVFCTALFVAQAAAQAPAAPGGAPPQPAPDELVKLVGPIALYPDDLVAIILPAATSPLQIVQADRYLEKRKTDPKLPIDSKWDDPIKSLLNYPDVVKKMSNDLDWTSDLGEAVVTNQAAVLEAVQVFRRQAQAAGNLKSDAKQVVKTEKEIIIIQPADPQVVYVPQYNPSTVVVYSAAPVYGYYPTPYPSYYYPYAPGAAMAAGVIWGAAIGAAWSGNHYGWGGGNEININRNTNVNVGSGNTVNRGQGGQSASQWKSNKQPGQVSNSVGKSAPANRAGDAGGRGGAGGVGGAGSAGGVGGAGGAGGAGGVGSGALASTQPAAGGSRGGDSALGGYGSGRETSMDSSRGASSRSSASGGYKPTASSSASRGSYGGGGASRGGGGSGGRR